MIPTLIVLGLLGLGVAIVVFATRPRGSGAARPVDPKTGWDAAPTPADGSRAEGELTQADPTDTGESIPAKEARS